MSSQAIDFTGIHRPDVVVAIGAEGTHRSKDLLARLDGDTLLMAAADIELPAGGASLRRIDFKALGIKNADRALAALALLAKLGRIIRPQMLAAAIDLRFAERVREAARLLVERIWAESV